MIRWITEQLGTAAWDHVNNIKDIYIVDVRDLVDKGGNQPQIVKAKIDEAIAHLQKNEKVIICCDYGMSRSNAIAAGVMAIQKNIGLEEAVRHIIAVTGESAIKIEVLSVVRKSLDATFQRTSTLEKDDPQLLVTGASGFIGSSLLPKLKQRYMVVAPTSQELNLVKDTVILDLLIKEHNINTILHLANPRIYTTNEAMGTAMVMLKNVLDVCKLNKIKLIYLSNWEIYSGYRSEGLFASESLQPFPKGTYGETKHLSEILIHQYEQLYDIKTLILRSSPVYGLGSDKPKFIHNFIKKAYQHVDIVTHKYLNGFPHLDLVHINDLSEILSISISKDLNGVYNIGTGILTSTTRVAEIIIELLQSDSKIIYNDIADYAPNIAMDMFSINKQIDYNLKIDVKMGVEKLINSYENKGEVNG